MKSIFGFFLKTFADDYNYVERLIESFNKHNKDNLVVPNVFNERVSFI